MWDDFSISPFLPAMLEPPVQGLELPISSTPVMIDDWSRTNIDTEGLVAVCTRVVIHPPVKYGPTSWDTKALANDGWCFCSNNVTSGELFLVHV